MSVTANSKAWVQRVRRAAPLAWRHDQVFRWAVIVSGIALAVLLTQAGQLVLFSSDAGSLSGMPAHHARGSGPTHGSASF